jgi:hypothetical protein
VSQVLSPFLEIACYGTLLALVITVVVYALAVFVEICRDWREK